MREPYREPIQHLPQLGRLGDALLLVRLDDVHAPDVDLEEEASHGCADVRGDVVGGVGGGEDGVAHC